MEMEFEGGIIAASANGIFKLLDKIYPNAYQGKFYRLTRLVARYGTNLLIRLLENGPRAVRTLMRDTAIQARAEINATLLPHVTQFPRTPISSRSRRGRGLDDSSRLRHRIAIRNQHVANAQSPPTVPLAASQPTPQPNSQSSTGLPPVQTHPQSSRQRQQAPLPASSLKTLSDRPSWTPAPMFSIPKEQEQAHAAREEAAKQAALDADIRRMREEVLKAKEEERARQQRDEEDRKAQEVKANEEAQARKLLQERHEKEEKDSLSYSQNALDHLSEWTGFNPADSMKPAPVLPRIPCLSSEEMRTMPDLYVALLRYSVQNTPQVIDHRAEARIAQLQQIHHYGYELLGDLEVFGLGLKMQRIDMLRQISTSLVRDHMVPGVNLIMSLTPPITQEEIGLINWPFKELEVAHDRLDGVADLPLELQTLLSAIIEFSLFIKRAFPTGLGLVPHVQPSTTINPFASAPAALPNTNGHAQQTSETVQIPAQEEQGFQIRGQSAISQGPPLGPTYWSIQGISQAAPTTTQESSGHQTAPAFPSPQTAAPISNKGKQPAISNNASNPAVSASTSDTAKTYSEVVNHVQSEHEELRRHANLLKDDFKHGRMPSSEVLNTLEGIVQPVLRLHGNPSRITRNEAREFIKYANELRGAIHKSFKKTKYQTDVDLTSFQSTLTDVCGLLGVDVKIMP